MDDDCTNYVPPRSPSRPYCVRHTPSSKQQAVVCSTRLPPRPNNGRTSKQQEYWEEMNRREKMDRKYENATPETDHQIEELNAEKSKEKNRRLQWDLDWESQSRATVSADNTNPDLAALPAPITSEPPTAPETPDIRSSKSKRGFAKFSKFLLKPWTKARRTLGLRG